MFARVRQDSSWQVTAPMANEVYSLYEHLEVCSTASDVEIRRAFRNLVTREHPDKGGSPERFTRIKQAYEVLSNASKREAQSDSERDIIQCCLVLVVVGRGQKAKYDATGEVLRTAEEEFLDDFAAGTFNRWTAKATAQPGPDISEQIALLSNGNQPTSFSAGFEAWMRSRGDEGTSIFTADAMAEKFGVVKGTYGRVPLPKIKANQVICDQISPSKEQIQVVSEALPQELSWGEVLVSLRAAPINPCDICNLQTGVYGEDAVHAPFVPGMDGVGIVMKVGDGVKGFREKDWVVPFKPHMGTWRSLAVWRAADIMKIPSDVLSIEHAALTTQLCLAYALLEEVKALKPGDCVVLNAASSTVGQAIVQLCRVLQLRCIALVRDHGRLEQTQAWLQELGATHVLADEDSVHEKIDEMKFFAKPKLGLDAVGGVASARLSSILAEGSRVIVYSCCSGESPVWPWEAWVFKHMQVQGFNLRAWMARHRSRVPVIIEAIAKLINAGKLQLRYTEYEMASELKEALQHASDKGINTKVLLRMADIGETY